MQGYMDHEESGKYDTTKRNEYSSKGKETEICALPDNKFKIIVLKKLSEMQENTGRQLNKIKKMMHE